MRDIRFRAWDKVSETMYTDAINNCEDPFDLVLKYPQVYEVMEYTELKDKNGVRIYEGDILQYHDKKGRLIAQVKVIRSNGSWDGEPLGKYHSWRYYRSFHDCEVIGNIYENPELLKEGE